jgi:hypothetical protein
MSERDVERERAQLAADIAALIDRLSGGARDDAARDALLARVLKFQRTHVAPYARIVAHGGLGDGEVLRWPGVPTDVFRFVRVASHDAARDVRVFRTSGTTQSQRGAHALRDLALYDKSARAWAKHMLFGDVERMRLAVLAPPVQELPDSSLSYMLDRFAPWFGKGASVVIWRDGALDLALLEATLREAERAGEAIALLGTSFAFVHADDGLGAARFALPAGSRVMQTGGFKGKSRGVAPDQMRSMLSARYGVADDAIIAEYGMTELCSQLYERTKPRRLLAPGWVRVMLVDPETLQPAREGEEGLVRIDDLANLDTVCAIQTSDRGVRVADGIVVLGRAPSAVPRGCSIAVDAVLAGEHAGERG